jgi:hypothetical protein
MGNGRRHDEGLVMTPTSRLVREIAAQVGQAGSTARSLSQFLGPAREKYTGSGYALAPADARFARVWIGVRADAGTPEALTDVDLELAPSSPLPLADLDRELGTRHDVPPAPSGPVHRVAYDRDLGGAAFEVTVFATLSGPPDLPGTQVRQLLVRRDER